MLRPVQRPHAAVVFGPDAEVFQIGVCGDGRKRDVTTFELLLISVRDLAMGGNLRAVKWLDEYRVRLNLEGETGVGHLVHLKTVIQIHIEPTLRYQLP